MPTKLYIMTEAELKAEMDISLAKAQATGEEIGNLVLKAMFRTLSSKDGNITPLSDYVSRLKEKGVNVKRLVSWIKTTFPVKYEKQKITGLTRDWQKFELEIFGVLNGSDWLTFEAEAKESKFDLEARLKTLIKSATDKAGEASESIIINPVVYDDLLKLCIKHKLI